MAAQSDVLRISGTTRNAVNYWRASGVLATPLASTTPGIARDLSRENALEIAFMTALTGSGMSPRNAKDIVVDWMDKVMSGKLQAFAIMRPDKAVAISTSNYGVRDLVDSFRTFVGDAHESANNVLETAVYSLIDLGLIVSRIDTLFLVASPGDSGRAPAKMRSHLGRARRQKRRSR